MQISSSIGIFDASTIYLGGTAINKILMDNVKRGFSSTQDSVSDLSLDADVSRLERIHSDDFISINITASKNISASGKIIAESADITSLDGGLF